MRKNAPKPPVIRDLFGFSSDDGQHELHAEGAPLHALAAALREAAEVVRRLQRGPYDTSDLAHRARALLIRECSGPVRASRDSNGEAIVIEGSREALDMLADEIDDYARSRGDLLRVSDTLTIEGVL